MAPQRIVSLCPSITETLIAIGGFKRLVGAMRYCVRPKGMLWGLPRIGGTKDPDIAQDHPHGPDVHRLDVVAGPHVRSARRDHPGTGARLRHAVCGLAAPRASRAPWLAGGALVLAGIVVSELKWKRSRIDSLEV